MRFASSIWPVLALLLCFMARSLAIPTDVSDDGSPSDIPSVDSRALTAGTLCATVPVKARLLFLTYVREATSEVGIKLILKSLDTDRPPSKTHPGPSTSLVLIVFTNRVSVFAL